MLKTSPRMIVTTTNYPFNNTSSYKLGYNNIFWLEHKQMNNIMVFN